ncbi:MAG: response regulator [Oscillospiraceae bacterium]|nr:response regulator [Oscillospiraceae bacterium]
MIEYYIITTVLAIVNLFALIVVVDNKKINYYFILLMLIMAISNAGYLAVGLSETVQEAVLATKVSYIGGCFTSPLMILLICSICKYDFGKWFRIGIYAYCLIVYFMVLTIGYNDLYYTEYHLDSLWDSTILVNEYGIGHSMFYLILYGAIIVQMVMLIHSTIKKRSVSRKNLFLLFGLEVMNVSLFFIGRLINADFEVMPALYVFNGWFFLVIHYRLRCYNIEESVAEVLQKNQNNGYIMFDEAFNYVGCNKTAESVFTQLEKCYIDYPIKGISELEDVIKAYPKDNKDNKEYITTVTVGDRHFECRFNRRFYNDKVYGYMLELVEDTYKWKHINYLSDNNTELEQTVRAQNAELIKKQEAIEKIFVQTVTALSEAVDAKDRYTSGHSKRVAEYARMLAKRMGMSEEEQEEIYRAGLLHDIGKIRIPVEIINKAGKLTDEEYNIIKIHPVTGYNILRGIAGNNLIALAAKYHHERYDGRGYPNGLVGETIPLAARILAVADTYDAMTSNRSYRKALPQDVVRAEIEKGKGTQFDPDIAEIMLHVIDEDKDYTMCQGEELTRKILTVDDEPINNKILAHIMKDEPMYELKSVDSGEAELELLKNEVFDLIMLDVNMHGMSGLETLQHIREKYDIPVVIMTADKNLDTASEFAALGCDDFITKPFLPLLIKEVVHNTTERIEI